MTTYAYDLAISAVQYDTILVAELVDRLTPRLRTTPVWVGHSTSVPSDASSTLLADSARVALVLHQRLWSHDLATQSDDAALRVRFRRRPESIRVVALDHSPLPEMWASLERCDFAAAGLNGVAQFALDAIAASEGSVRRALPEPEPPGEVPRGWSQAPPPYLAQPRAFSSLRRELDAITTESESHLQTARDRSTGRVVELHSIPHRMFARVDDMAISFSWVSGGLRSVSDGRLLVIEWGGVATQSKGMKALSSATAIRERVYHAESTGPDNWCWRGDEPHGRACSTANLVAEWFAAASIAMSDVTGGSATAVA
jgi:hypothetical protein